jgi:hypothetical protein
MSERFSPEVMYYFLFIFLFLASKRIPVRDVLSIQCGYSMGIGLKPGRSHIENISGLNLGRL